MTEAQAQLVHVPPASLKKSPTNPRKQLGDITSLIESVKTKGVLEPILARPNGGPDHLEIVCGERRWTAATKAELESVPVLVRELDDDEVLDVQLAENLERADLSPLEEAEAYKLRVERKQTIAHIAERIGRTPSYVAQRLKLTELAPRVRESLAKGELTLGVAMLIARIPDRKLQEEAFSDVGPRNGGPTSAKEAAHRIQDRFMLRLDNAGFDRADPRLVPGAGACTTCVKRTGNQTELFADVKSPDLCTDPPCFRSKLDALWQLKRKDELVAGRKVLEGKAFQKDAASYGASKFKRLDEKEWDGGKERSVRALFGKELPPITLGQDPQTGQVVELVRREEVDRALKRSKPKSDYNPRTGKTTAQDRKDKIERLAVEKVLELAIAKADKLAPTTVLEYVTRSFAARAWNEVQKAALKRRGVEVPKGTSLETAIVKYATTLSNADLAGFGLELALRSAAPGSWGSPDRIWADGLLMLKVDFSKVKLDVSAELAAKEKGKPAKKTAAKPEKKPAKRPVKK